MGGHGIVCVSATAEVPGERVDRHGAELESDSEEVQADTETVDVVEQASTLA